MKLKIVLAVTMASIVLFTGCSSKDVSIKKGQGENSNIREISAAQGSEHTKAGMINATNTKLLQAVAEETIASGNQYFIFTQPSAIADARLETTDAYLSKCANKSVGGNVALTVFTLGLAGGLCFDDCDMFGGATGVGGAGSGATVKLFKDRPNSPAFDANAVLADLKAKKLYRTMENGVEYVEQKSR